MLAVSRDADAAAGQRGTSRAHKTNDRKWKEIVRPRCIERILNLTSGLSKYHVGTYLEGEPSIIGVRAYKASTFTDDGVNDALAPFVAERARLRAHADESHRVRAHKGRSVLEPNRPRALLRPDVVKPDLPKNGLQRTRIAEAVTPVGNRSHMSFCDGA